MTEEYTHTKQRVYLSLFIPTILTIIMWVVKIMEWLFSASFASGGILPRSFKNLHGIIFSSFIHRDWGHLWANTLPFFILSWALFFFYKTIALRIFIIMYLASSVILWITGRYAFHIGMSNMIYSLATFVTISGLVKGNYRLTALSLIVIFLYGSLVWGLFPIMENVSWEGHLSGALVGLLLAILYRHKGPQKPPPIDDDDSIAEEIWNAEVFKQQVEENEDYQKNDTSTNY